MIRWKVNKKRRQPPPRDDRVTSVRAITVQRPPVSGQLLLERACCTVVALATSALCHWAWSYFQSRKCLRTYGRDMTGEGDPVIGRDDEIDRVVDILCRRTKNCAALVGAAGVGKTAVAEGLAQRIASGAVPDALVGARVVEVDLAAMVAGTRYRGMFEERMKNVIKRAEASNGKIILFVDEMHMLYSAGSSRTNCTSASNMLKPALARGRIRCVGATTFDEYRQYVEKDPALERRFQKVHVGEPSIEATIAILRGLKQRFQDHHGHEIQDAALVAAAHLGARYITGRQFPDKAIDLIDEACTFIARKMKQIDNQLLVDDNTTPNSLNDANKKVVVNPKSSSTNRVKKAIVDPNDVAL
ncbi:unnamed protein product [Triticum turgidum subsp. durum]|uniref:AAA+ ATPase domain-containing protein n=1 Tax=Triticum turgidum subsp. durum TaxID=4567 RepID=A0A9R1PGH2_TRITD|nr:unnamed protein product [Triticum turgidum subsp. durum]